MRSKDYYYVDDLFKKLGIYKEAMTVEEVIASLRIHIKYLADYVPANDEQNKALYNTACKTIHMGEFSGFNITDMYQLATIADDYSRNYQVGDYFTQISNWKLNIEREPVPVNIDFREAKGDNAINPVYYICKESLSELAKFILSKIKAVSPELLEGKGYAALSFTVSEGIQLPLGPSLVLRLTKALILIQKSFPKFDYYCTSNARMFLAYTWAFNTYVLADKAFKIYFSERTKAGISMTEIVKDFKTDLACRRTAVREALTEHLGIKVGEIVLFSLVPFSQACPYLNIPISIIGTDGEGNILQEDSNMRKLDFDSLFLAKVVNYNDDYLVLKLKYELMSQTTNITIPIAWELLLPNLSDGMPSRTDTKAQVGFSKFRAKTSDDGFLQALNRVPVLLTAKNCASLQRPLFPIIYNKF